MIMGYYRQKSAGEHNESSLSDCRTQSVCIRRMLPYLLLAAVTVAVYIQTVWNDFLFHWDDQWVVINAFTDRGMSWSNIWDVVTQFYHGQYAPANELYYIIIYSLFGYNSYAFHAGSVLLHTANVLLTYRFVFLLSLKTQNGETAVAGRIAFFTALLFAVHPVCVESVAWLSASKILVYSLFYLTALIIYIRYIERKDAASYLLVLLLYILSFAGKEQAVVLVLCCALVDYAMRRREPVLLMVAEKVPMLFLALFFGLITILSQGDTSGGSMPQYDIMERCLLAFYSLFEYIVKAIVPYNLSYIYPFPFQPGDAVPFGIYLYPLYVLALGYLVFVFRRDRMIVFAALFFVIHVLVALHIVPISRFAVTADRYSYLSLIGCAFMIAYLSATRFRFTRWVKLALAVYVVCLSAMTLTYERHWRNTDMLKQNIREILKSRKDYDDGKKTLITAPVNAGH